MDTEFHPLWAVSPAYNNKNWLPFEWAAKLCKHIWEMANPSNVRFLRVSFYLAKMLSINSKCVATVKCWEKRRIHEITRNNGRCLYRDLLHWWKSRLIDFREIVFDSWVVTFWCFTHRFYKTLWMKLYLSRFSTFWLITVPKIKWKNWGIFWNIGNWFLTSIKYIWNSR